MLTLDVPEVNDEMFYGYFFDVYTRSGFNDLKEFRRNFIRLPPADEKLMLENPIHPNELKGWSEINRKDYAPHSVSSFSYLPYFRPFLPQYFQNKFAEQWDRNFATRARCLSLSESMISELRFCEFCRNEVYVNYGRKVWFRAHQMPGVFVCWKHEIPLKVVSAFPSRLLFPSDEQITEAKCAINETNDEWLWIAKSTKELFDGNFPYFGNEVHHGMNDFYQDSKWKSQWSQETLAELHRRYPDLADVASGITYIADLKGKRNISNLPLSRLLSIKARRHTIKSYIKKCKKLVGGQHLWSNYRRDYDVNALQTYFLDDRQIEFLYQLTFEDQQGWWYKIEARFKLFDQLVSKLFLDPACGYYFNLAAHFFPESGQKRRSHELSLKPSTISKIGSVLAIRQTGNFDSAMRFTLYAAIKRWEAKTGRSAAELMTRKWSGPHRGSKMERIGYDAYSDQFLTEKEFRELYSYSWKKRDPV